MVRANDYIRVELQNLSRTGAPVVTYDKVFFVDSKGKETEISHSISKIVIREGIGEARQIELTLFGADITMQPPKNK